MQSSRATAARLISFTGAGDTCAQLTKPGCPPKWEQSGQQPATINQNPACSKCKKDTKKQNQTEKPGTTTTATQPNHQQHQPQHQQQLLLASIQLGLATHIYIYVYRKNKNKPG